MRVRMLIGISGFNENGPWPQIGEVANVGDVVGAKLIGNGYAEPVADAAPKPAPKAASKRSPKNTGTAGGE